MTFRPTLRRALAISPEPIVFHFPAPYEPGETRQYRLSQEMAKSRRVFFVDDRPIERLSRRHVVPSFSLGERVGAVQVIHRDLGRGFAAIRRRSWRLASAINGHYLRRFMQTLGHSTYSCYSIGPNPDFGFKRRPSTLIIEFNDPPFDGNDEAFWHQGRLISARADVVFATSPALQRLASAEGQTVYLVPNAVDAELPKAPVRSAERQDKVLAHIGTIDWRIDLDFIERLSQLLPEWEVILAGRVNRERRQEVEAMCPSPNIRFMGTVSESEKISILRRCCVGLVANIANPIGDAINPTKVYEYAAYGLPVISTDTDASRALRPSVVTAATPQDAAAALANFEALPTPGEMIDFAKKNTWALRAAFIETILAQQTIAAPHS